MRFENKVVVVTGGGSGIGKAVSECFANEGAFVIVADWNDEKGQAVSTTIQSNGGRADYIQTDISSEEDVKQLVQTVREKYGRIDVLVNNAAVFMLRPVSASVDDWKRVLGVNIIGTALCSRYVSEAMKENNGGAIVNVASISGVIAQPKQMTYNVTKAGIIEMTRCLALDLAPYKIRVNSVSPGNVQTPGLDAALKYHKLTHEEAAGGCILKRIADPEEIASAILFLSSEKESSYITGENLMVDGGYTTL